MNDHSGSRAPVRRRRKPTLSGSKMSVAAGGGTAVSATAHVQWLFWPMSGRLATSVKRPLEHWRVPSCSAAWRVMSSRRWVFPLARPQKTLVRYRVDLAYATSSTRIPRDVRRYRRGTWSQIGPETATQRHGCLRLYVQCAYLANSHSALIAVCDFNGLFATLFARNITTHPQPRYSTVTLLARLRGLSTSVPRATAVW